MNITADKFISLKEELKLFKALATAAATGDKQAVIDNMLFQLLNLTGLRISEALALTWKDIGEDYILVKGTTKVSSIPLKDSGKILVRKRTTTKGGNTQETVHIGNKLLELLAEFKLLNPYSESKHLFNTRKGPYKRTNAHERLKYWLKVAGIRDSISCHSFRHTYATRCLDANLPLTVVRDQLRHSSIAVTSVYLHFSKENKELLKKVF